ncbi:MAG: DUF5686 family protein [Bacteroidota bacterium]
MLKFLFIILSFLQSFFLYSQTLKGVLTDENGTPVPGANIYIKNSYVGVLTDKNGSYQISLKPGKQTIIFKMMGFNTIEKELDVYGNTLFKFDTTLSINALLLNEAVISADRRSLGKSIMQNVKDKRKGYLDSVENFQCKIYRRISLENIEPKHIKDSVEQNIKDSLESKLNKEEKRKNKHALKKAARRQSKDTAKSKSQDTYMVQYISDLDETIATLYYNRPAKYKESVIAENTYDIKWPRQFYFMAGMDMSEGIEIENIDYQPSNPYVQVNDAVTADFNFYKASTAQPSICIKPLLSPIAPGSALSYVYDYEGVIYSENKKYFKIKVKPLFPADALYSGSLVVEDSTWALHSVDLSINPDVLLFCKSFRVQQSYQMISGISVPKQSTFTYIIKDGKRTITGITDVIYSNYILNDTIPQKTFSSEVKEYRVLALEKDSAWWEDNRSFDLTLNEKKFIKSTDSLSAYYNSNDYIFKTDSSSNRIDIWNILYEGISHMNRKNQTMYFVNPLIAQINPLGIGGYRHSLGGYFFKRFQNDYLFESEGLLNYGFANNDMRYKAGAGLTYIPRKFVRTFFRFGDFYDQINNNASISSMFSRSNYARTKMFSIAQRMEIINGLFGELTYTFSDQTPINDMQQDQWSDDLFGTINTPLDFTRYIKSEFQLELKYLLHQKFVMKNNRKILLGSSWPEISFRWRKGVQGLLNSEVNYDYLELGASHELKMARWGRLSWSLFGGSFVNKTHLRILEYKYFRGSDKLFFSSPARTLQLLSPTLSSSSAFFQFNVIHHFEGAIIDKVPLMSRLKIGLAAGGGGLFMQENSFRHAEIFGGLERVFRIRRQLFRIGVFAVTADNNLSKADFTIKFGVNFYNSFSRKWDY